MKYIVSCLWVLGMIVAWPGFVQAERTMALTQTERVHLLERIQELLQEVVRLQALLGEQQSLTREPYESVLFTVPMEAYYFVEGGELASVSGTDIRETDQVLFDLFVETLGRDVVSRYVAEWRVFNDDELDIDAYVESVDDTGRYVVSINRSGFTAERAAVVDSYRKLFIHEYAHMLLFAEPGITEVFSKAFWTGADVAHKNRFAVATRDRRASLLTQYYERNEHRFVSDYATVSPEEDMAEIFMYLVTETDTSGGTLIEDKQAFIQEIPRLNVEIERLKKRYF